MGYKDKKTLCCCCLKKNLNASGPSEHLPVSGIFFCFSHSAYLLPTRKNYFIFYTVVVAIPLLVVLKRGKREQKNRKPGSAAAVKPLAAPSAHYFQLIYDLLIITVQ